jgi:hypothetical protein
MGSSANISYSRSNNNGEFLGILDVQRRNVKTVLSGDEMQSDGFVTVVHSLELLRKMHRLCPHILAKNGDVVVGYALAMVPELRLDIPVLAALFEITDDLLPGRDYLVMGQICIDKPFRGKGLFSGMYEFYREQLHREFECLVTEVSESNQRSLQAHLHVGFEILHTRLDKGEEWKMLVWNWRIN